MVKFSRLTPSSGPVCSTLLHCTHSSVGEEAADKPASSADEGNNNAAQFVNIDMEIIPLLVAV